MGYSLKYIDYGEGYFCLRHSGRGNMKLETIKKLLTSDLAVKKFVLNCGSLYF